MMHLLHAAETLSRFRKKVAKRGEGPRQCRWWGNAWAARDRQRLRYAVGFF